MKKEYILVILFIALLVILFFGYVLFTDLSFVYRDFSRYFYPLYQYGSSCIKEGIMPFWNPHIYCGMPFLALIQLATFYPLSIIFYLFPFMFSVKLFIVIHYFLAGLFIYLLMRDLGLNTPSALISSISYTFSGYMLSCVDLTNTLISATWIPLIFLLYFRALKTQGLLFTIFTGAVLGIQLLGGDPVVFYITLIVLFLFTLIHFSFKAFFRYFLTVIISIGLTLFQTLPFLELTSLSVRAKGIGIWEATKWSCGKYEFLNLICPFFTDANQLLQQRFFESIASGILPIFLTLIAIFFIHFKNRLVIFWAIILLMATILSFGENLWVYKLFHKYLPLFDMIRYPIKFFCIINFSISILAGFGFKYLLDNFKQKRYFLIIPAFSLILICIFCWIFSCIWYNEIFFFKVVNKPLYNHIYSPAINILFLCIIPFLSCVSKRIELRTFSFVIIGFVILNSVIFGLELNPLIKQALYDDIPQSVNFIKKEDGFSRFLLNLHTEEEHRFIESRTFVEEFREMQSILLPNIGLYYLLFDAYGYEAVPIRDYDRFIYYVKNEELSKTLRLISMINVRYIISDEPILEKGIKLTHLIKDGNRIIRIYENTSVLPRTYLVSKVILVKDRSKVFKKLISADFEPEREVILEDEIKCHMPTAKCQMPHAEIIDYQPNKVTIIAYSPTNCILFLSDTYYPGWKAYVDGKEAKIYRANYIFRAVEFPKGRHKVEFVYSPISFNAGLLGSMLTLILLVIYQVLYNRLGKGF